MELQGIFPLSHPNQKWTPERIKSVVRDLLNGVSITTIVEKQKCSAWIVRDIRDGKYKPELVAQFAAEVKAERQ